MKSFSQVLAGLIVVFCMTNNVSAVQQSCCQQLAIPQYVPSATYPQPCVTTVLGMPQCMPSQQCPPHAYVPPVHSYFPPVVIQQNFVQQSPSCQSWTNYPLVEGSIVVAEPSWNAPLQATQSPCPCNSKVADRLAAALGESRKAGCSSAKLKLTREQAEELKKTFAMLKNASPQQRMSACQQYCDTFFPDEPCSGECRGQCPFIWVDECDCDCWDTPWGEECDCELTILPPHSIDPGDP